VSLPMEQMTARAGDDALTDPLASVRACALTVLERLTADAQCQRVFEISCHKVEYVDEMEQLRARHIECRTGCLAQIERGLRNAVKKRQLPASVNPRYAAIGLYALVDGLIMNWVLDPKALPLAKAAAPLVDTFLAGLGAAAPRRAPKRQAVRRR